MKVEHISDINKFFDVVEQCKGRVELDTGEGDRLNLKSKLCQYVSMANILSNGAGSSCLRKGRYRPSDFFYDEQRLST